MSSLMYSKAVILELCASGTRARQAIVQCGVRDEQPTTTPVKTLEKIGNGITMGWVVGEVGGGEAEG